MKENAPTELTEAYTPQQDLRALMRDAGCSQHQVSNAYAVIHSLARLSHFLASPHDLIGERPAPASEAFQQSRAGGRGMLLT